MWSSLRTGVGYRTPGIGKAVSCPSPAPCRPPPIFLILFLLALPSCGFEPIHGERGGQGRTSLEAIRVESFPGRPGQLLKTALEDELNPQGRDVTPLYRLRGELSAQTTPQVIDAAGIASRYQIIFTLSFRLVRIADNQTVREDKSWRSVSYNVSQADYSTYIASQDAMKRGVQELARDCAQRLAAYLSHEENTP